MDNDQKLIVFMETMGGTVDVEVARSLLEINDWNLEAALNTVMGGGSAPAAPAPAPVLDEFGYRAPMRTGYTDTLMGPTNPAQERELAEQRRQEELLRQQQEEERRKAAELAAQKQREEQVRQMRERAERQAAERQSQQISQQVARQRLEADPEAMRREQEQKQREEEQAKKKAEEEALRQQQEELRKKREAEKAEQDALDAARRHEAQRLEELEREKLEAERRRLSAEAEDAASSKEKDVDEFKSALLALLRRYKETDPSGLATCLRTMRTYVDNLARNPLEPKFQRINCDNSAFKTRVAAYEGATAVLIACGFREEEGALAVDSEFAKSKGPRLWDALAKIEVVLNQVSSS